MGVWFIKQADAKFVNSFEYAHREKVKLLSSCGNDLSMYQ